jgi:putative ABC transport system permease protein
MSLVDDRGMINFSYLKAELFRRRTKTFLIALGLAVPIALTILVGGYQTGLSKAQDEVLQPLVGLGTDMTVTKNMAPGQNGGERPPRFNFGSGSAGQSFSRDAYTTGFSGAYSSTNVTKVAKLDGVESAVGALTVENVKASGELPSMSSGTQNGPPGGAAQGGGGQGGGFNIDRRTITGIDPFSDLGPVSSNQLQKGSLLSDNDAKEALVSSSYAKSESLTVSESVKIKDTKFKIVGIVSSPLAGSSSDIYVKLDQLQTAADLKNKINRIYVRAESQDQVEAVSKEITSTISGATVTTNSSLASQVSGSLVDANKLVDKMSKFLILILLLAAVAITTILTLNAVNKRTREFGTLKSIGWGDGRLIRQVMAESLSIGAIGALAGVALGGIGMLAAKAFPLTMKVSGAASGGFGGPGGGAPPGMGSGATGGPPGMARQAVEAASQTVSVIPQISLTTVAIAAAIGAATALIAGGLGALKTSKLSPVEALKHVD